MNLPLRPFYRVLVLLAVAVACVTSSSAAITYRLHSIDSDGDLGDFDNDDNFFAYVVDDLDDNNPSTFRGRYIIKAYAQGYAYDSGWGSIMSDDMDADIPAVFDSNGDLLLPIGSPYGGYLEEGYGTTRPFIGNGGATLRVPEGLLFD